MFNKVLASAFIFYKQYKREDPYYDSVIIVGLCQYEILFFFLALMKKLLGLNLMEIFPNRYIFLLVVIMWMIVLFIYYKKDKINLILQNHNELNREQKRRWNIITVILLVIPIMAGALLLTK